jgi:hypothetical protein
MKRRARFYFVLAQASRTVIVSAAEDSRTQMILFAAAKI